MLTSFTIESMDIAKVYIRNTGQNPLTSLSVYVNDAPAHFNMTPSIAPGLIGTITIYDYIADGDTIKITSPSGFATSKKATDPCEKAVACWKLDESAGSTAYDSSPYGSSGSINGASRTSGRSGNALYFDGVNDYVTMGDQSILDFGTSSFTVSIWMKSSSITSFGILFTKIGSSRGYACYSSDMSNALRCALGDGTTLSGHTFSANIAPFDGSWHFVTFMVNRSENRAYAYMDGIRSTDYWDISSFGSLDTTAQFALALNQGGSYYNGTIDEVRIYNRAIY
jgi:hypothetical protein